MDLFLVLNIGNMNGEGTYYRPIGERNDYESETNERKE